MDPAGVNQYLDKRGGQFDDDHQADIRGSLAAFHFVRPELPLTSTAG